MTSSPYVISHKLPGKRVKMEVLNNVLMRNFGFKSHCDFSRDAYSIISFPHRIPVPYKTVHNTLDKYFIKISKTLPDNSGNLGNPVVHDNRYDEDYNEDEEDEDEEVPY